MNLKEEWNMISAFLGKEGKAMKRISFLIGMVCILVMFAGTAFAGDVYVRGYYRSNGTYVRPHYRSAPDGNSWNNWSTYPNVNRYTGKLGTRRGYGSYSRSYRGYSFGSYGTRSGRFR
ncbi:MAG: hypothetical protein KAU38_10365 [Desulfobacterales bacterium]|nr:hypothetical protein [Desulfobacterales bacterium]